MGDGLRIFLLFFRGEIYSTGSLRGWVVAEMYGVCCACCASVALTILGPQNVFTIFFFDWKGGEGERGLLCSFLFSPHFFPQWLAASCGLARPRIPFRSLIVARHVAGKEGRRIFGWWAAFLKRTNRMVDHRSRMALVGLSSVRWEEVPSADKESNRLYSKTQVWGECVYFISIRVYRRWCNGELSKWDTCMSDQ